MKKRCSFIIGFLSYYQKELPDGLKQVMDSMDEHEMRDPKRLKPCDIQFELVDVRNWGYQL